MNDRTRRYAYAAVIGFHLVTGALFPIGMFPYIMAASALVFFPPDWPRKLFARLSRRFYAPAGVDDSVWTPQTLGITQRLGVGSALAMTRKLA